MSNTQTTSLPTINDACEDCRKPADSRDLTFDGLCVVCSHKRAVVRAVRRIGVAEVMRAVATA